MQPNGSAAPERGNSTEQPPLSDVESNAEIVHLADLSTLDYGRQRSASAQKLGLSVAWLDKLVREKKAAIVEEAGRGGIETAGQGRAINLPDPEPWPEPIDGAELLAALVEQVERYMVMEPGAAERVALWLLHTHVFQAFGITPRLAITSPRPQCGKTTLLDILQRLVVRPLLAANLTAAAVFRVVEVALPTLLVDEADTFLPNNDELRGVLNSGHRRGGTVIRVVGEDMEPRQFSTFSPAAIAMIGHLPGTLADRSVSITLKRKRADEPVESFRYDRSQDLDRLARMCARWAKDNADRLRGLDPVVPSNLYNRAADNWRPLLAIAEAAGGDWPERARAIAAATVDSDQVKRVGLLADIREVFDSKGVDRVKSADLAAALVAMEGHPWAEHGRTGKPLTANGLARMLAGDNIAPKVMRFRLDEVGRGYEREQFEDVFERYLPSTPKPTVTTLQAEDFCGSQPASQVLQPEPCNGCGEAQSPRIPAVCNGVTDGEAGEAPRTEKVRLRL
jgi:putative DNA primase/helicase